MFRIAAVPLVQPQDVHAPRERLCGEALHVVRLARPVQAVQREQRRMLPGPRLPVAVCNDPRVERHVEVAPGRRRQRGEIARVSPAVERHPVAVPERRAWLEPIHHSIIPDGHAVLPRVPSYDTIATYLEVFMRAPRLLSFAVAIIATVSLAAAPGQQPAGSATATAKP